MEATPTWALPLALAMVRILSPSSLQFNALFMLIWKADVLQDIC